MTNLFWFKAFQEKIQCHASSYRNLVSGKILVLRFWDKQLSANQIC